MKEQFRIIKSGAEARKALKKGIDKVANIVKRTLGPGGRNALIELKAKPPRITNDGVSIAREIILADEIEDLGAQSAINGCVKTNEMVGDGTTTTMVLTQAIIGKIYEDLDEEENSILENTQNLMNIKKQIDKECKEVVEKLKAEAAIIKDKTDLRNVAITAVEDEELGNIVGDMIDKVGAEGYIAVDDSYAYDTEIDVIEGMKFYGKYAADFMITNPARKESVFQNCSVLITNQAIETPEILRPICGQAAKAGLTSLVIMSPQFTPLTLAGIYRTSRDAKFHILALKCASLTDWEWEDVAIFLGGQFFDKTKKLTIEKAQLPQLGRAEKIIATEDEVMLIGGGGNKEVVANRIIELREQMAKEQDIMFRNKLDRRIGSLSGGIGQIKVGGKTDLEKHYKRLKIEDAVCACRAAVKEGIVKGGGVALKEIADELPETYLLKKPLLTPYETIKENLGLAQSDELQIENIIDPLKVVRISLENACSLAGSFITTENAVAWKRSTLDHLRELIAGKEAWEYD